MHFHRRPSWFIPEREVTPERVFLDRRAVLAGLGFAGVAAAAGLPRPAAARPAGEAWTPPRSTPPTPTPAAR